MQRSGHNISVLAHLFHAIHDILGAGLDGEDALAGGNLHLVVGVVGDDH
jgi:hypothetical protein